MSNFNCENNNRKQTNNNSQNCETSSFANSYSPWNESATPVDLRKPNFQNVTTYNSVEKAKNSSKKIVSVPIICCCIIAFAVVCLSATLIVLNFSRNNVDELYQEDYNDDVVDVYTSESDTDYSEAATLSEETIIITTEQPTTKAVTTEVTKVERKQYFPYVNGFEDVSGHYVTKGKRYDCDDGSVYYLPDIIVEGEYSDYVEDELERIADERCDRVPGVMYMGFECHVYVVEHIISIYIAFWGQDYGAPYCYNINSKTGEEVTDAELLETLGISQDDYNERAIELQKMEITKRLSSYNRGTFENPEILDNFKESYEEMTTDDYFLSANLYVDGGGYLHIVNLLPQMEVGHSVADIIYT